jgi:hypothetical protein
MHLSSLTFLANPLLLYQAEASLGEEVERPLVTEHRSANGLKSFMVAPLVLSLSMIRLSSIHRYRCGSCHQSPSLLCCRACS